MMFTEKEQLLANEAALTASLLSNGLNALRRADVYNQGLYYQAFFSLSIGIERLLKMIILSQHRYENNGDFPTNINLRKLGHDIVKLCEYIGVNFGTNTIYFDILSFLNVFAKKSRYYNIDSMLNADISYTNPLNDWAVISEKILNSVNQKKVIQNKKSLSNMLDSISEISFYDLSGKEHSSAIFMLDEWETREVIQSYSVQYVFQIIVKLTEQIRQLERKKFLTPVLSEFFALYNTYWKPWEIRRKKDWCRV